jgi:hypothetical protein
MTPFPFLGWWQVWQRSRLVARCHARPQINSLAALVATRKRKPLESSTGNAVEEQGRGSGSVTVWEQPGFFITVDYLGQRHSAMATRPVKIR